ncbi:alpha-L-fucosidase [Coraliomargarita akajimensis]|uniref:alpha-L-fucosidase n=1 Tax=Coraliomargarita akajimensis (strain DSM 45221 / IAM 15411 / JCM 23193 / KCTC 12865 / 04OKA010-24) TaxID=583355 RepID=D5EN97_CORAD|nr:alpha-L-fucosidase [Coraliomargarita akajimensis]ADE53532.1 Alpha-L-fucosidase [Coraliomargarita akajimensis DSM 45221]
MNTSKLTRILSASLLACATQATSASEERFEASWESLQQYNCPEWFRDAKFGIYAHWGINSAAGVSDNSDWYSRYMYMEGTANHKHHLAVHGELDEVGYKDLAPLFTADQFDADEWAELYVASGARFAGPSAEHSDGFSMWDSKVNAFNSVKMGPQRDVVGEMEAALRKRGLKVMVSFHHSWLWGWYPTWDANTDCADPANELYYGPKLPESARMPGPDNWCDAADPMPSVEFERVWLEKVKEVVDGYSPDLLWFDNRGQILSEDVRQQAAAYYYNDTDAKEIEAVLTYKRPDMPLGTGIVDLERARMPDIYPEPWLTDTSISSNSWNWTSDLEYYSTNRLIDDLVDIVSKNGCMLLNVAPHPNGTIPDEQKQRLLEMGAWLRLNGEAIYESRPWLIYGEGPNKTKTGHLADMKFDGFGEKDIRFTTRDGQLYAIALGWPESGVLAIESLSAIRHNGEFKAIELIGHKGALKWEQTKDALNITLPDSKPCEHAFVFKLTRKKKQL